MIPIIRGSKGEEGKTLGALEPEDGGSFCRQKPLLELEMMDKKKILIVDDDQNLAMALKTSFELQGFNVFVGLDGPQGLKLAETRSPT
jgi:PleD family two-component response regulator